jgi:hypothetical protein
MVRVKAAGQTLTVGELREALSGLDDNADVIAHDRRIALALTSAVSLELDPDVAARDEDDFDVLMSFVRMADELTASSNTLSVTTLRKHAREIYECTSRLRQEYDS